MPRQQYQLSILLYLLLWHSLLNNPVDNYYIFNNFNTFGYLVLSFEKYLEKNIISIKKVNLWIIDLILEESYEKTFLIDNPNIIKFNDWIINIFGGIQLENNTENQFKKLISNSFGNLNKLILNHSIRLSNSCLVENFI